ncbi:hypothetical protein EDD86DRAFT_243910 [Gorgonomyces haynaldii]|nr:hypothetical protein EDD86DRAFT_243910 [Gorgonomyces haynaldii]
MTSLLYAQYRNIECLGPPTVLYLFQTDYTSFERGNETWPSFYTLQMQEYSIEICGNYVPQTFGICCYTSTDPSLAYPYLSGGPQVLETGNALDYLPKTAIGSTFCHLTADQTLFGYQEIYLLANGECIDQWQCHSNGTLFIYASENCQSPAHAILLTAEPKHVISDLSQFQAEMIVVRNASVQYLWNAWTPSSKLVPTFQIWQEDLSIACYIISGMICFWMIGSQLSIMYRLPEQRSPWNMSCLFQFTLWLLYLGVNYGFWTTIFHSDVEMAWYGEFDRLLWHFSTFVSTTLTCTVFVKALESLSQRQHTIMLFGLFVIHLAVGLPKYLYYYMNVSESRLTDAEISIVRILIAWNQAYFVWMGFVFLWNTTPLLVLMHLVLKHRLPHSNILERLQKVVLVDPMTIVCFGLQIPTLAGYYYVQAVTVLSTTVLGSDRAFLATMGYTNLLIVVHTLLAWRSGLGVKRLNKLIQDNHEVTFGPEATGIETYQK